MSLFDSASLVVTPNGYKEDKLYSIKPTDGSGDLVVTRATTATRVNSDGLIEVTPYNLVRYSEDIDNSAWAKYNVTISANSTNAPNGTLTAEKLLSSNSTSFQGIEIQVNYISGQKYTNSIYFKYIDTPFVQIITPSFVSSNYVNFNIQTGEVVGGVYEDATVMSFGNGWYRCSFTFISNYTGSGGTIGAANLINSASSSRASDFTGDGVKGIYLWGAQLVTGTSAKEYFPTTDRLNVPRLDYTNSTCPSILVEPQRTNLCAYSEQFDNAAWAKTRATITANATTSPDGNNTADLVSDTTFTNNINYTENFISVSANITTISVFVKKGTAPYVSFGFYDNDFHGFVVNTTTWASSHTYGSATNFTATNYGNGWYRLSMTKQSATNFIYPSIAVQQNSNGSNYNGTGALNAYFWGYQIEVGSYATSYIPTVASSVTRNADVISKTGISSLIGQTEGTLFFDVIINDVQSGNVFFHLEGTSPDVNFQTGGGILYFYSPSNFSISTAVLPNTRYKIAARYKNNDIALYVNGILIGTDESATITPKSDLYLNSEIGLYVADLKINSAVLWKNAFTNSQLAELTTL